MHEIFSNSLLVSFNIDRLFELPEFAIFNVHILTKKRRVKTACDIFRTNGFRSTKI